MQLTPLKKYAEICGLPVRTIRRLCQEGKLPAMQIGRAYYVDEDAANAELAETVKLSTAHKRAAPVITEDCRPAKKFDFLKELGRLKQEAAQ